MGFIPQKSPLILVPFIDPLIPPALSSTALGALKATKQEPDPLLFSKDLKVKLEITVLAAVVSK